MKILTTFVVLCLSSVGLFSQAVSVSQISGTVRDASGAAVPSARIAITQTDTALVRTAESDANGGYLLPSLPIGPYRLEVSRDGFSTYVQQGIVLQVNTNPTIDVVLAVGAVSEKVVVEAAAAMVETQNSGVGQVIDQQRVVDLPLNGRNATQLISLVGGASATNNYANLTSTKNYPGEAVVSVAGGMLNGLTYLLDGSSHNDPFNNLNLPLPFPNALQEFKVETSALPAQYGHHSAGAVNAVTKSGTNELHGDAFEFVRNQLFNSRDFFAATRDTIKRNQFGGTLGGKIIKDKLFFFLGYQGTILKSAPTEAFAFVPTQAMLAGDFTQVTAPACNANRQVNLPAPFVNNRINPNQFSAPALAVLKYYDPLPTSACGRLQFGKLSNQKEYTGVTRVDYQMTSNHSIFARYFATHIFVPSSYNGQQITMTTPMFDDLINSASVGDTYVMGPNAINSFRATFNRTAVVKESPAFFDPPKLGIPNWTVLLPGFTRMNVTNAFETACNVCPLGAIFTTTYQLADDLSLIRGNHQISVGMNWITPLHHSQLNGSTGGTFNFTGAATGLSMADFMLGKLNNFSQGNAQRNSARHHYVGLYVQDSWRATPRFKVNYGLRWEPFIGGKSQYGQFAHFDTNLFRQNAKSVVYPNAPPGVLFVGDPGFNTNSRPHNIRWNNFAPRLGVVWDPKGDGKTSIRASWGIFYDLPHTLFFDDYSKLSPWGTSVTVNNPAGGLADPWGPGGNPFPTVLSKNFVFPNNGYWETVPLNVRSTYVEQWNFSVQRQMGKNWLASASYLGNNTVHLWTNQELNPSIFIPGSSTAANVAQRRLFTLLNPVDGPKIGTMNHLDDGGTASYNAMLLSLQHRFANSFTLLGNYTWSHCISDVITTELSGPSYVNPNDRRMDRGNCRSVDVRHILNLSGVARVPKFSGKALRMVASDWQIAVIASANSGSYFDVTTGVDNALIGINTTAGVSHQRPDQILENPYCAVKSYSCWVNPDAFRAAPAGRFGTLGNNSILGPAFFNVDLALSRTFAITERHRIEIRAEAFNVQNRVNFNTPTTINYPYGPSAVMTNTTFGKSTSSNGPRIMQFAMRYIF